MIMGDRIKTRRQLFDEQADAARTRATGDQRPDGREHPNPPRTALTGAHRLR
jgi:hypothetical protein